MTATEKQTVREVAEYLDLKAQQYATEYEPNHAIRLSCDRMRDKLRKLLAQ